VLRARVTSSSIEEDCVAISSANFSCERGLGRLEGSESYDGRESLEIQEGEGGAGLAGVKLEDSLKDRGR